MMTLEVVGANRLSVQDIREAYGWGDEATEVNIQGEIMQLVISGGNGRVGIRITDSGELIITDYGNSVYQTTIQQNYRLSPARPWNA